MEKADGGQEIILCCRSVVKKKQNDGKEQSSPIFMLQAVEPDKFLP